MNSLWARVEPLLARVTKPARYIGCEDGAATPRHALGKVYSLLAYPDTYEIGLPNQGPQNLYEILNERDDAVAQCTYAPWRDDAIEDLSVAEANHASTPDDTRPHLYAVLATNGRGLRPTGLVATLFPALDPVDSTARVLRTHQWIERDGVRREHHPCAPDRDARPGGVRMRRDFTHGQQRTRLGHHARQGCCRNTHPADAAAKWARR